MVEVGAGPVRVARCACGDLRLGLAGEPDRVYACACLECQRATGSAFAYRARFAKRAIVRDEGPRRVWRRGSDAGRWVEQTFCPNCGTLVFMTAEALPDGLVVSAGCLDDSDFAPPAALFWEARRRPWWELRCSGTP